MAGSSLAGSRIRNRQHKHPKTDRISKLPPTIIETILCLLPIQEAAMTSILSKEWRYHWTKIPKLEFIEDAFEVSTHGAERFENPNKRKDMAKRCKLFYAIYQVLLMHQGPIHEFTLHMEVDDSCVEIDHIILHLSKKNIVKILKLDFDDKDDGGCPLRKSLTMSSDDATIVDTGEFTIVDLFECLPVIEYLSCFIREGLPKELPTKLAHLKCLRIKFFCFGHKYGLPFLVLLMRSSPNLEKLELVMEDIDWLDEDDMGSFTLEDYSDIMLDHLNELEIMGFSDAEYELDFVNLVLAKSHVLKKVRIVTYRHFDEDEESEISKILLCSTCVSPGVKITVGKFRSN